MKTNSSIILVLVVIPLVALMLARIIFLQKRIKEKVENNLNKQS